MSEKKRLAWANRDANGYGARRNAALLPEVQERIAASVRALWDEGRYDDRVNGMSGRVGPQHPSWTWGKEHFRAILAQHEASECVFCGAVDGLNAHHVDERHENYLLSNLLWACVPCHAWKLHYRRSRLPVVTISKRTAFEYAHILPWHPGKCAQLHGHSGHLEVFVRGRLDPNGVVMDFKDLGDAVKVAVFDVLDHKLLNDYLPNATSENLLVWVWRQLESIGVKGLAQVSFSETDSSTCSLTAADMVDAFGWAKDGETWVMVPKVTEDR